MKRFLLFLIKRLLLLLEAGLKLCLFLPIVVFMLWFSYKVDISGLFQGELAPREVTTMLLDETNVSNYEQMDERAILALYAQNVEESAMPKTLAVGSSRVLQMDEGMVGTSFFNVGMSGASAMDIMSSYYLFVRAGKTPENLIICIDPWLFNPIAAAELNQKSDVELYDEFLKEGLGLDVDYEKPDTVELWKALVDPAYFQGNVTYYLRQRSTGIAETEEGERIPFHPIASPIGNYDFAVKRGDGSIYYPQNFRSWSEEEVLNEALAQAGTLTAMHGFDGMDPGLTSRFDQFVQYARRQGSNVIFLLTPYHPFICLHVYNNPQEFAGFFEVEPWLRSYAQKNGIPLYGSYHPSRVGIPEALFFDGVHCKPEALKMMFPGVKAAVKNKQTVYQSLYLRDWGDELNAKDALVGFEGNSVVVSDEWLRFAQKATDANAVFEPASTDKNPK